MSSASLNALVSLEPFWTLRALRSLRTLATGHPFIALHTLVAWLSNNTFRSDRSRLALGSRVSFVP
ncbi:hypothetical protein NL533_32955, partial [Klebsiella pneumoniae]|nr:hypothetical protein [Klebsiella pneumoniae]